MFILAHSLDFQKDINWDVESFDVIYSAREKKTWVALAINEDGISAIYLLNITDKQYHKADFGVVCYFYFVTSWIVFTYSDLCL